MKTFCYNIAKYKYTNKTLGLIGLIAQLAERSLDVRKVRGSSPLGPTIESN